MSIPNSADRDRPWVFRTYSGHSSAQASNALYRDNLEKGQTGLSVAFDLPTQTGVDSDHPLARGEVGKVGVPMRTAYCAAKHGLVGYGDALRAECAMHGLHVLTVAPGSVRTNVSRNALSADGTKRGVSDRAIDQGLEPDAVAERILQALEQDEREIVIADGMEAGLPGLRAESPEQAFDLMARLVSEGYAKRMDDQ